MKKIILFFSFICLSTVIIAQNQSPQTQNKEYLNLLGQSLEKLKNQNNTSNLKECVNDLKRINAIYPNEWLSSYYIAYLDISLSLESPMDQKTPLLSEAISIIGKLKENTDALESEVYTLDGYYYYALIATNPQKNGEVYYKNVIESYQQAININKNNPRPALLLVIFKFKMAKFMNQNTDDLCNELIGVKKLFTQFKAEYPLYPSWGENQLINCTKEYCSNKK